MRQTDAADRCGRQMRQTDAADRCGSNLFSLLSKLALVRKSMKGNTMSQFFAGIFLGAIIGGVAGYIVSLCRGRIGANGGVCGETSGQADIPGGPMVAPPPSEKRLPSVAAVPAVVRRGIVQRSRLFSQKPFSYFPDECPT